MNERRDSDRVNESGMDRREQDRKWLAVICLYMPSLSCDLTEQLRLSADLREASTGIPWWADA